MALSKKDKKNVDTKKMIQVFHKATRTLGSAGIATLAMTSCGDEITISKTGFTFVEMIYLIRDLAQTHPREFDLALKMADFTEATVPESDTVH
jgi:hypothetical protein